MAGQHNGRIWFIIDRIVFSVTENGATHDEQSFTATRLKGTPTTECMHRCIRATDEVSALQKWATRCNA